MKVAVLFSGGKDSSLAALLLEPFFDETGRPVPDVLDEAGEVLCGGIGEEPFALQGHAVHEAVTARAALTIGGRFDIACGEEGGELLADAGLGHGQVGREARDVAFAFKLDRFEDAQLRGRREIRYLEH